MRGRPYWRFAYSDLHRVPPLPPRAPVGSGKTGAAHPRLATWRKQCHLCNVPTSPVRPMTRWPRAETDAVQGRRRAGSVAFWPTHVTLEQVIAMRGKASRKRRALLLVGGIDSGCTTPAPTGAGRTARSARDSRPRTRTSPRCTDPGGFRDPGGSRARGHKSPATHPHCRRARIRVCKVLHACREALRCPPGPGTLGQKRGNSFAQVGMRHDHPRPRSSKKPPEGGGDPVEQQVGKGIKLVIHQRHDRRAIPPSTCL